MKTRFLKRFNNNSLIAIILYTSKTSRNENASSILIKATFSFKIIELSNNIDAYCANIVPSSSFLLIHNFFIFMKDFNSKHRFDDRNIIFLIMMFIDNVMFMLIYNKIS